MDFIKILFQRSKHLYPFIILLSIVNSSLNFGILYIINSVVTQNPIPFFPNYEWLIFVITVTCSLFVNRYTQVYMVKFTNNIIYDFEIAVLTKLKNTCFQNFEKLGNEKIYTAFQDTRVLSNIPGLVINALKSFFIIVCCFGYLLTMSFENTLAIFVVMLAMLVFYIRRNKSIEADLNIIRDLKDDFHRYLNDLLRGFREVKMSSYRNDNIYRSFLIKTRTTSKDLNVRTSIKYLQNELTGSYSWYLILGVILFVLPPLLKLQIKELSAFVITVMYMMGPVAILITLVPNWTNIKIALKRLKHFDSKIDEFIKPAFRVNNQESEYFKTLVFDQVTYKYITNEGGFFLGPISLEISRGEVIYCTGGNGSGKSTFVNILTGVYLPSGGNIFFNGRKISSEDVAFYSDQFSVIFSNNHLFSENYDGFDLTDSNEELNRYIHLMQIADKIVRESNNLISYKLSRGQQKRLAMIYAMLENKQILVLDEWAAEQDLEFRQYFYLKFVPFLKKLGKTIIVITHDEAYFSRAERRIKFEFGKIVMDQGMSSRSQDAELITKS